MTMMSDNARRRSSAEQVEKLLAEHDPKATKASEFLGHQFDLGLAWVNFPKGTVGSD